MKTVIAFVAGVVIASAAVYLLFEGRAAQPAAPLTAMLKLDAPEKPSPAEPAQQPIVVDSAPSAPQRKPVMMARQQPAPIQVAAMPPAPPIQPVERPVESKPSAAPIQQAPLPPAPLPAPEPVVERTPNTVTLTANTTLIVRMAQTISTERDMSGDEFSATLDQPLVIDGFVVAERGSRMEGRIVASERAGRMRGAAHLELELTKLNSSDGQRINIRTNTYQRNGESSRRDDAAKVGIGAALGAAIGAMAGGGKGAAIGAGAGGAAGVGAVAGSRGNDAMLPVESRVSFRLLLPITITEQLQ